MLWSAGAQYEANLFMGTWPQLVWFSFMQQRPSGFMTFSLRRIEPKDTAAHSPEERFRCEAPFGFPTRKESLKVIALDKVKVNQNISLSGVNRINHAFL